jgi:hypothetical protein
VLGVSHDGRPVEPSLDAPRPGTGLDAAERTRRLEIEHDDVALEVGGDERDRRFLESGGRCSRVECERDGERSTRDEELAPVHLP